MKKVYLDNNATTGLDPRVLEAMLPYLSEAPLNPSSIHSFGQEAKALLTKSREKIASFLQVLPHEILFTSGGTEAMNFLIQGLPQKGHILTSNVEHACVYHSLKTSQQETEFLQAGQKGAVEPEQVEKALRPSTQCILLSAVNSETGVKIDLEAIAEIALKAGVPLFVDGVALLGKELFTLPKGVTAMGFSGHKFHGPKGTGFVFLRSSQKMNPLLKGGSQEFGMRAGTENLAGIVGLSRAVELLKKELPQASTHMALLRDRLEESLVQKMGALINGTGPRICNVSNLSFPGVQGEDLLIALDMAGIAASHGSACSAGSMEPSRILLEMQTPFALAKGAIRFSFSRMNTFEEVEHALPVISSLVKQLRGIN